MFMNLEKNIGDTSIDLNKYKWVLGTGCSYGAMVRSVFDPFDSLNVDQDNLPKKIKGNFPKILHDTSDTIISINVPLSSQGVSWQSDSIIYLTNYLLNNGVSSENIYCFVEWSQWSRETAHLTHILNIDYNSIGFGEFKKNGHDIRICCSQNGKTTDLKELDDYHDILDLVRNINISTAEPGGSSVGQIGENVYISIYNTNVDNLCNSIGYDSKFLVEEMIKISDSTPIEIRLKRYLHSILQVQYFLKSKNIKYNFIQMQSDFDNWIVEGDLIRHILTHTNEKEITISNKHSSENFIENRFPQLKYIFEQIDLSNFWFYKNKLMERGGIDEWALSEFGESGYSYVLDMYIHNNRIVLDKENVNDKLPYFGNHPNELLYILIWNEAASNCDFLKVNPKLEKWIKELYFEDYNYDGDSKNFFILSKKYIEKLKQKF